MSMAWAQLVELDIEDDVELDAELDAELDVEPDAEPAVGACFVDAYLVALVVALVAEQVVVVVVSDVAIEIGFGYASPSVTPEKEIDLSMAAKGVSPQGAVLLVAVVEADSEEAYCCASRWHRKEF